MRPDQHDSPDMTALPGAAAAVHSQIGGDQTVVAPSRDVAFINAVVNDPSVRPHVGPEYLGELDLSEAVARPENLCLFGRWGGFLLAWSAPGVREVHTMILPDGRGAWARRARVEMIAYCTAQGDTMLWTKIPADQPHVRRFALEGGMRPVGMTVATFGLPYEIYSMELAQCQ